MNHNLLNQNPTDGHLSSFQYFAAHVANMNSLHLCRYIYGVNSTVGLLESAFLILLGIANLPFKGLKPWTLPLTMLTSASFPTALPTECAIKFLGACQSDRWKIMSQDSLTRISLILGGVEQLLICLRANSISFVVASPFTSIYFPQILLGSWPFSL